MSRAPLLSRTIAGAGSRDRRLTLAPLISRAFMPIRLGGADEIEFVGVAPSKRQFPRELHGSAPIR